MENQFLKNQLNQCERVKNEQIFGLQQELARVTQHHRAVKGSELRQNCSEQTENSS